ncbi:MAG TPA: O-antigen ligase family protein [Candidatus Scatomorpha intestinavium]|uniref:O-antigen ligase family protein n=1 Tax=Candidatus Scatomorpha intestinavium TaxID=2840922 RepID=A0A9D0ZD03_9FIRM|nr:O-antigen ligase family protein [Candidatus Scatomorpha intestinavium]
MLKSSVLGRLYGWWLCSAIFRLLRGIYRPFARAFPNSAVVNFLRRPPKIERWYANSLVCRAIDAVYRFLLRIFGAIINALRPAAGGSFFVRAASGSYFLRFEVLLGCFTFVMFVAPHEMWSNSYAVLGAAGLFGVAFLMSAAGARREVFPREFGLPFLLFVMACVGSLGFTSDRSDSLRVLMFFAAAFLFMYAAVIGISTKEQLRRLMGFIYAAVMFTALYAFYQRVMGVEVSASFTDLDLNVGVPGRVYSTLDNPNNYAEFLVLFTPLSTAYAMTEKRTFRRLVLSCLIVLPLGALVMTYSRGCWLSIALSVVIFVYYTDKRLIPVGLVACILLIPFLPDSIMTRISTIFNSHDSSANHRLTTWRGIINMIGDYGITGIGMGPNTFAELYPDYALTGATRGVYHSQMLYMELILETGALGFISFMWFMLREVKNAAFDLFKARSQEVRMALIACGASFGGIAVAGIFEYIWFYPRVLFAFFILLGVMLAAARLAREEGCAR